MAKLPSFLGHLTWLTRQCCSNRIVGRWGCLCASFPLQRHLHDQGNDFLTCHWKEPCPRPWINTYCAITLLSMNRQTMAWTIVLHHASVSPDHWLLPYVFQKREILSAKNYSTFPLDFSTSLSVIQMLLCWANTFSLQWIWVHLYSVSVQCFPQVTQRLDKKSSPISSAGSPRKVSFLQDGWPINRTTRKIPEMDNNELWLLFKKLP